MQNSYSDVIKSVTDKINELDDDIKIDKVKMAQISEVITIKEGKKQKLISAIQSLTEIERLINNEEVAVVETGFLSFYDARNVMRQFRLKNSTDFNRFCKEGKRPQGIPSSPYKTYKQNWDEFPDSSAAWEFFLCVQENRDIDNALLEINEKSKNYDLSGK
jgi:hypothetical protein